MSQFRLDEARKELVAAEEALKESTLALCFHSDPYLRCVERVRIAEAVYNACVDKEVYNAVVRAKSE